MAGTNNGNGEDKAMVDPQKQYLIEQFGNLMEKVGEGYGGCLLYTSPSPRDATLSRMPSSA